MLDKTVTRIFPTDNEIGIHLVLTDDERPDLGEGAQVVVNETFTRNIPTAINMTDKVRDELGLEAQAEINHYKRLREIYDKPLYQTKVNQIKNNLTVE